MLLYLRRGIRRIPLPPGARLGWLLIPDTLSIAIFRLSIKQPIEGETHNLYITPMPIGFGLIRGIAAVNGAQRLPYDRLGWRHGLLPGFARARALVPGVSGSGGTISAVLSLGHTREAAARYSFLPAISAMLTSGPFELVGSRGDPSPIGGAPTPAATVLAVRVDYGVIVGFLRLLKPAISGRSSFIGC